MEFGTFDPDNPPNESVDDDWQDENQEVLFSVDARTEASEPVNQAGTGDCRPAVFIEMVYPPACQRRPKRSHQLRPIETIYRTPPDVDA